jgi:hypothetical protein
MPWLAAGLTKKQIKQLIRRRFRSPFEDAAEFERETDTLITEYAPDGPRGPAGAAISWMDQLDAELARQWGIHVAEMRSMKMRETVHGSPEPSYKR